jgi:hypothetical protein
MASLKLDPPSDELLARVPPPSLPAIAKRWLMIMKPWVLAQLIFNIIAAELLVRSGYPGDRSVIIQTRSTRAFFLRCWLSLHGWIDKKQLVEFIDQHMDVFQKKGLIKFEFWDGLKHKIYWARFSEIDCLKIFKDGIFSMIIDTYLFEILIKGEQDGIIQDRDLIWKKKNRK